MTAKKKKTPKKPADRFDMKIWGTFVNRTTGEEGTGFDYRANNVSWADLTATEKGLVAQIDKQIDAAIAKHVK